MAESSRKEIIGTFLSKVKEIGNVEGYEVHAIIMLREILPFVSEFGSYWFQYGYYLKEVGRLQDSIKAITKSLEFESFGLRWPSYLMLGQLLTETNKWLEADYWYELAIKEEKMPPGYFWLLRGNNIFKLGDFEKAKEFYRNAFKDLSEDFDKDQAFLSLGEVCCILGYYDVGLNYLKKSYSLDPSIPRTKLILKDVSNLKNVVLKNSEFPLIHDSELNNTLVREYIENQWYFSALEVLRVYLKQFPRSSEFWKLLGECFMNIGAGNDGMDAFEKALEFGEAKDQAHVFSSIGELCIEYRSLSEANDWFEKTIKCQEVVEDWIWFRRGEVLNKMGKYLEAVDCFKESINCEGGWIEPDEKFFSIGLMYRNLERFEDATSSLSEALRLNPKNEKAKVALKGLIEIENTIDSTFKECEKLKDIIG